MAQQQETELTTLLSGGEVKKLLTVKNKILTEKLLKKIVEGEKVCLNINNAKELSWEGEILLTFDVCRCGNPNYNVVSILRDLLKKGVKIEKTRKQLEGSICFNS